MLAGLLGHYVQLIHSLAFFFKKKGLNNFNIETNEHISYSFLPSQVIIPVVWCILSGYGP